MVFFLFDFIVLKNQDPTFLEFLNVLSYERKKEREEKPILVVYLFLCIVWKTRFFLGKNFMLH